MNGRKIALIIAAWTLAIGIAVTGGVPALGDVDEEQAEGDNDDRFDLNETEELFIKFLNVERSSRGLQNVSHRSGLTQMGQSHSRDMAERNYFDHVEPDGTTIEDRYQSRGLLPECNLPIDGSENYYPGAENIARTYVYRTFQPNWRAQHYSIYTERELAWDLFQQWMNSEGHREVLLLQSADEAGLGIHIEGDMVYASLELC